LHQVRNQFYRENTAFHALIVHLPAKFDLTDVSFHYFIYRCNPPILLFQHLDPSVQLSDLHPKLLVRSSTFPDSWPIATFF
jgi:hypothetical protein